MEDLIYKIGITLIPGVGAVNAKTLIAYCGGAKSVFTEKQSALKKIPGIGINTVQSIVNQNVLQRAEEEVNFIQKNNINALFYLDNEYPNRLKNCYDSPIMLYTKGNASFNNQNMLSVVGTRSSTEYGKDICNKIIKDLSNYNPSIVSGLAYGIDTIAHKAAIDNKLSTIAVLGHGLDMLYPALNKELSKSILEKGALVTEFMSKTIPDKENFPKRNRIIAGMSDATLVIEAGIKGGALITAEIAASYNRDVFAIPGRVTDIYSQGCNYLIRNNIGNLCQDAKDIIYFLNWKPSEKTNKPVQTNLFINLSTQEKNIVDYISKEENPQIDKIMTGTNMQLSTVAKVLLDLELKGVIRCLPGKIYKIVQ